MIVYKTTCGALVHANVLNGTWSSGLSSTCSKQLPRATGGVRVRTTNWILYVTVLDGTWNGMELGVMNCMTVED